MRILIVMGTRNASDVLILIILEVLYETTKLTKLVLKKQRLNPYYTGSTL